MFISAVSTRPRHKLTNAHIRSHSGYSRQPKVAFGAAEATSGVNLSAPGDGERAVHLDRAEAAFAGVAQIHAVDDQCEVVPGRYVP
jgi:hypothetical protein